MLGPKVLQKGSFLAHCSEKACAQFRLSIASCWFPSTVLAELGFVLLLSGRDVCMLNVPS